MTEGVHMDIGVLGTGIVGRTIGTRLVGLGHQVVMGSRTADNADAAEWAAEVGTGASHGTFADAGAAGEMLINCTAGVGSLDALTSVGAELLAGKVIVDISVPLDFSAGFPPSLFVCNTDSLGEQIQRAFPDARVVKTLNTMNNQVMIHPERLPGAHSVFVSGDDAEAKQFVTGMLESFGWPRGSVVDLGGIETARGPEMYLVLWIELMQAGGAPDFNVNVVRAPG
jgi:predicted dinucleotide-binding enzyme